MPRRTQRQGFRHEIKTVRCGINHCIRGKPFQLYIIGQVFNLVLTFVVVWFLLCGKFFPIPTINT